jgi:two-component sensor histidine kinase
MRAQRDVRVLVVEDELLIADMIQHILEDMGYHVVGTVTGGRGAIDRVAELAGTSSRPDVILMDIGLPDMDGIEAIEEIQSFCPTPVVILTGYDMPELVQRASASGVGAYLVKPPNPNELERAITITIARFGDMMELRRLNAELQAEVAERERTEERLKASLEEKEILLKEVHHRVKNNLQIVSSLLELQSFSVEDEQAQQAFSSSQNRIRSMAQIHEHLYRSHDLTQVDMATYTEDLVQQLCQSYGARSVVSEIDIDAVCVDMDAAVPLGLIITELVSNALKYAFPPNKPRANDRPPTVRVSLHRSAADSTTSDAAGLGPSEQFELVVSDNGIGLPSELDLGDPTSLGLTLVQVLSEQLDGHFYLPPPDRGRHSIFRVTFPASVLGAT